MTSEGVWPCPFKAGTEVPASAFDMVILMQLFYVGRCRQSFRNKHFVYNYSLTKIAKAKNNNIFIVDNICN
jgi:hypothetical protein